MGYRSWVMGYGLWVMSFLPNTYNLSPITCFTYHLLPTTYYVNGNSMMETLYLIPVGHVQYSLMEILAKSLEEQFNIPSKISKEFQIPPEAYDRKRDQYHSSIILKRLKGFLPQSDGALSLGITEHDLYVPSLNFVFGEASPEDGIAIISLQRLRQEFYGLNENDEVLQRRMVTEAVHELGHVYGLMHCSNPKCVMFFSNTLTDTDRKSDKFCEKCGKVFEKVRKK